MTNKLIPTSLTANQFRALIGFRPKQILVANGKLGKDHIWSVTLPAYEGYYLQKGNLTRIQTCPQAGVCKAYCYASTATYRFKGSMVKHARNLNFLINDPFGFADQVVGEIERKKNVRAVRFNDSGDIFNDGYWAVMVDIMNRLPHIQFYAYSKRVSFLKSKVWPKNFTAVFSQGGTEDHLIDPEKDRHARVFPSRAALRAAGYSDGTHTDRLAASPKFRKVGLVIHGNHLALKRLRKAAERGQKAWQTSQTLKTMEA